MKKKHLVIVLVFGLVCGSATPTGGQPGPQAAQNNPYQSLAPGVTTRARFATDLSFSGGPALQVKVYDWIVGPRQEISNFPLEGFAIIEVKSGTIESTIGGQTVQHHQGEHWAVPEGAQLAVRVPSNTGRGDNLVSLRGVVVIRK